MKYYFGIDVGGTTVKQGLFDEDYNLLERWEIRTDKTRGGRNIIPKIAGSLEDCLERNKISKKDIIATGMGVPGPVTKDGFINKAVNLGWGRFNLKKEAKKSLGVPVFCGNDANLAGYGEFHFGSGKEFDNIIFITIGTGIGGCIINEGKILIGTDGSGAEIGHIHVKDDEEDSCGCGNKGCLEQYTSAKGIGRTARRMLATTDEPSVLRDSVINAKIIFDAIKEGDKLAIKVGEEFGRYLGCAMANLANITNPQAIILGGGVSKAGDILLTFLEEPFKKNVFHACKNVKLLCASIKNDAGIYGAAKLAGDSINNK
ncbi:glucokinase [Acetitomaculum ruminis DSM 5522]|uniref:Glucokinase n=1 Tax=Acetitomaculum ruminis DSM 5522 TaxID=1120918 RepID=A0A1I0XZ70_9FIRM|nr:ROK family glucokinase [Acetitomaculum ruminis]SFB06272.1 glucokinase [Acetitomaculum ruminis DSM 5522]